ncbi:ester cyclase [Photobacterium sp. MCCC 1A19761]|uniref:nuclear transport factor 2 family protein n=1 Tax=Photobacterium sp. MCCC 1A19761 TaxID=3115000 RepID=UPI00307EBAEF
MSKSNEWVIRWFSDIWQRADGRLLSEYAADPFSFHLPGGRVRTVSHQEYLGYLDIWGQRFRDVKFTVQDIVNEGDRTVALYHCSAIYNGGWAKIPARKQQVEMTGMVYFLRQNHLITTCRMEDSSFDLYQQLTRYLE